MSVTPIYLRLDDTNVEQIVRKAVAGFQSKVPDRHTAIRQDVNVALITHCPAGLGEQAIDIFPGFVFGGGHLLIVQKRERTLRQRPGAGSKLEEIAGSLAIWWQSDNNYLETC